MAKNGRCQKCADAQARATDALGLLNTTQGRVVDLELALKKIAETPAHPLALQDIKAIVHSVMPT